MIKNPSLAQTFRTIAREPHSFYNGSLSHEIVEDVKEAGGIITLDDLREYKVLLLLYD